MNRQNTKPRGIVLIPLLIMIGSVVAFGVMAYVIIQGYRTTSENTVTTNTNSVACTLEAKLCPDGSYVSRIPPSCDYAACPTANIPTGWVLYTNNAFGFSFFYPPNLQFSEYGGAGSYLPLVSLGEKGKLSGVTGEDELSLTLSPVSIGQELSARSGTPKTIGGRSGYVRDPIQGIEGRYKEALLPFGERTLLFLASEDRWEILDEILNNFRFSETSEVTNWQKYSDTELKFSLSLPPGWQIEKNYKNDENAVRFYGPYQHNNVVVERELFMKKMPNDDVLSLLVNPTHQTINGNETVEGTRTDFVSVLFTDIIGDAGVYQFWRDYGLDTWLHHQILSTFQFTN